MAACPPVQNPVTNATQSVTADCDDDMAVNVPPPPPVDPPMPS